MWFRSLVVLTALFSFTHTLSAQANRVTNFSFETQDTNNPNLALNWSSSYGGYSRVQLSPGAWDGGYVAKLENKPGSTAQMRGAVQRVVLNQSVPKPVLISMVLKGVEIQDISTDKYGAAPYCKVIYVDGTTEIPNWCAQTAKIKMVGTFDWVRVYWNTAQSQINGDKPIKSVEAGPSLGPITGTVYFDDIHIAEFDPGSFTGAVTFSGDDAPTSHYTLAMPILASYGWKGAEAAVSDWLQSGDPNYMDVAQLHEMENSGWEILSHGKTHSDLSLLSPVYMEDELYWSKKFFKDNGFKVSSIALPKGGYNGRVITTNQQSYYFSSVRKVETGYNPMGASPVDVKVQSLYWNTTIQEVEFWLSEARKRKAWLVILFHHIDPLCNQTIYYCTTDTMFRNVATAVQASTLPVVTYEAGLNLIKAPR